MRTGIILSALAAVTLSLFSCTRNEPLNPGGTGARITEDRLPSKEVRHVMVMIAGGYNSLSDYMKDDMNELAQSYLPAGTARSKDVLLVLSRFPYKRGDYSTPVSPVLFRLYAGADGNPVRDTLHRWDPETRLCDASTIREALQLTYDLFPAKGYGVVFSSHGSGWLPSGYYNDPEAYEREHGGQGSTDADTWSLRSLRARHEVFPPIPEYPAVKSLGQDRGEPESVEMELKDLAEAIPIHLDYFLMDACLMGCVEVAYALRGVADIVGFSPTEVMANGFDYNTISQRLLRPELDPVAVCQDYFAFYDAQTGSSRSATISVVDTRKMDDLAAVCRELFQVYRDQIQALPGSRVQGYFRVNRHYFYDLKDILVQAGITAEETERLDAALDKCLLYKADTPSFLSIPLLRTCGLSMYLPSMGTELLDTFYKENMAWNQATELVQ